MRLIYIGLIAFSLRGQTFEVKSLLDPAPLSGVWKHQMGDDPRWADPGFDDSAWPGVLMPEGAVNPGDGFSWYRFRVRLPENRPQEPLALMIGGFGTGQAYEVFWNGRRSGVMGEPGGNVFGLFLPKPHSFDVPKSTGEAVIAVRLRQATCPWVYRLDPVHRSSWIGGRKSINAFIEAWQGERLRQLQPQLLIAAALMMPGVFFLLLPLWRPDSPEHFWFALWLLSANATRVLSIYPEAFGIQICLLISWLVVLSSAVNSAGWVCLLGALFRSRLTAGVWLTAFVGSLMTSLPAVIATMGGDQPEFSRSIATLFLSLCLSFAYYELGWRTSTVEERVPEIHVAIIGYLATNFLVFISQIVWRTETFYVQGIMVRTLALLLFTLAMAALMNQRSARLQSERQRLGHEMESAAEVQSLLLASLPAAGDVYRIEPVYLPASEVGGDFYQILERADGSRLVLVGDVSGKGLKAAMLVAVVVGAVGSTYSSSPAVVLATINQALIGRSGAGFVTCCCARFDADGTVTIANAGHPSPYCDGLEVAVAAGLPLGIAPGFDYEEVVTRGELFTFVSDGVVEAENAQRELFGFDRTREISNKPAQSIADVAKAWGQNDDITVVTVRRVA